MNPIARPLSASLLALSLVALSSAARAAEPTAAASFLPSLTLTGQPLGSSPAPRAPALLPSLSSPRSLPGVPAESKPVPLQLDSGTFNLRTVTMLFPDGSPLATIYLFNVPLGSYDTGREYWYVSNGNIDGKLGADALTISVTDSSTTTAPSDPGYSPEQRFSQVQSPTSGWGTGWTTDPYTGGDLYAGPNDTYLRLVVSTGSPAYVLRVVWYQVLTGGSPANIDPTGSWSTISGSVPVPPGSTGYSIAQVTS